MSPWSRIPSVALAFALIACSPDSKDVAPLPALPADTVADALRPAAPASPFETVKTVALDLRVRLFEDPAQGGQSLPPRDRLVVATLADFDGHVVYRGSFPADGRLETVLALPATAKDMLLRLEAPGFRGRLVEIPSMASLARVSRTMVLVADENGPTAESDNDQDGVPWAWDADPRDPDVSFVNVVPSEGFLTVAFEDMYKSPEAGDADFNDFVADYRVTEYAARDRISRIEIEAIGRRQWSGWNHAFGTALTFDGAAQISIAHYASADAEEPSEVTTFSVADGPGPEQAVVELFHSTRKAVGRRSVATIAFALPVDPASLEAAPYDPYLYVWNTGYDVHLMGQESLPRVPQLYELQKNRPDDTFQDADGFPFALLVPPDWKTPGETQYIGRAHPVFDQWREEIDAPALADATE